jgi:hypothetical protein
MADTAVTVATRLDRPPPSRHTRWLVTLVSLDFGLSARKPLGASADIHR